MDWTKKNLNSIMFFSMIAALFITSLNFAIKINMYHGELDIYLPHYLGNQSILKTIFDPLCELDLDRSTFRAREIGNYFNLIDSKLLTHLFFYKIPAFISVIYYISLAITIYIVIAISNNIYSGNKNISKLFILLLLTSPPIILGGTFYRTNKIIAAAAVVISIFVIELIKNNSLHLKNKFHILILFFFSLIACLSDEQGFALILLIASCEIFKNVKGNFKSTVSLAVLIMSIAAAVSYREYLGPFLFEKITNIKVSGLNFEIGNILYVKNLIESFFLLFKYSNYLFGNLNLFIAGLLIIILAYKLYSKINLKNLFLLIFNIIALALIIHVMTLKAPQIFWPDIVSYYSLPIIGFIFSLSFIAMHNNIKLLNEINFFQYFLIILIIFNIASWRQNFIKITEGHIKYFRSADKVIDGVNSPKIDAERIISEMTQKNSVPGYNKKFDYGRDGIYAIKNSLLRLKGN
jgi:hypothetical protein